MKLKQYISTLKRGGAKKLAEKLVRHLRIYPKWLQGFRLPSGTLPCD